MDGLSLTPPLAGKAGLGWRGWQGLLITPQFGVRQRIAPIFIDDQWFEYTDNKEHEWIEDYCEICRKCQKECPTEAILDEKVTRIDALEGIGQMKTCVDIMKCFPYFAETLGCSICVKVCPFSEGAPKYHEIKSKFNSERSVK
jgi:epoxyqueuosine reductase QueG